MKNKKFWIIILGGLIVLVIVNVLIIFGGSLKENIIADYNEKHGKVNDLGDVINLMIKQAKASIRNFLDIGPGTIPDDVKYPTIKYDKELELLGEDYNLAIVLVKVNGSVDEVISSLDESDFEDEIHEYEKDFSVKITKKGFEKLLSNPYVIKIISLSPDKKGDKITLSVEKEVNVDKINSLAYDGNNLWGVGSINILSKIDKNTGEIKSSCNLSFDLTGVTFYDDNLWISSYSPNKIYRINPNLCELNDPCTKENGCVIDSWNITESHYPRGITTDGNYLYILEQNYKIEYIHTVVLKFDFDGNFVDYYIAPNEILGDITWDGKYFWIIGSNGYMNIGGGGSLLLDYFKIYQYDKDFNLIGESDKFEKETLDFFGITYDGENLWVSDRYNDKLRKLTIPEID